MILDPSDQSKPVESHVILKLKNISVLESHHNEQIEHKEKEEYLKIFKFYFKKANLYEAAYRKVQILKLTETHPSNVSL